MGLHVLLQMVRAHDIAVVNCELVNFLGLKRSRFGP